MSVERLSTPPLPRRGPSCPPALRLEELVAGEASSAQEVEHLSGCPACRDYVAALRAEQEAFFRARPAELFERKLAARVAPARRAWRRWVWVLPALAALVLVPRFFVAAPPVQLKGGPSFAAFYKRDGMREPLPVTADLRLREKDGLRFSYSSERERYLLILDLDGDGKVTAFFPPQGARSEKVAAASQRLLPGSVVLDRARGPEWLVAVFSDGPVEVASLVEPLRSTSPLAAQVALSCDGCQVLSLRFQKEP